MQTIVSITSQGQLTIPQGVLRALGVKRPTKATIDVQKGKLIVKPKKDFWSLGGSLRSSVSLSDQKLRTARKHFETSWAEQ